jgi:hypothetical protein
MIRYPVNSDDFPLFFELHETRDKGRNTAEVIRSHSIPAGKIILLGDSGGDGPHFEWGATAGAHLIASMIKPSLDNYCREKDIAINLRFGLDYTRHERTSLPQELRTNFMDLAEIIDEIVNS